MHLNSASRFRDFLSGLFVPLRSLQLLLEHPKLLGLFALPMMITLTIISGVIYALLIGAWSWSNHLFHEWIGTYASTASTLLTAVLGLLAIYLSFQALSLLIALIASPFNDWLAEETEKACGEGEIKLKLQSLIRVFFMDFRKTLLALILLIGLTLLGLIPGIGLFSLFGVSLLNAFIYLTYPMNRRKAGILSTFHWMGLNFPLVFGFGVATTILFSIPVLNLFALPLSVIGGTLVYLKK